MQNSQNRRRMCIISPPIVCHKPEEIIKEESKSPKPALLAKYVCAAAAFMILLRDGARSLFCRICGFFKEIKVDSLFQQFVRSFRIPRAAFYKSVSLFVFVLPIFAGALNLGFDLYISDQYIGVVKNYSYAEEMLSHANIELYEIHGANPVSAAPRLYLRFVGERGFDDDAKILENIKISGGQMQRAVALYSGTERLFLVSEQQSLEDILNAYKSAYHNENTVSSDIDTEISFISELALSSEILSIESAARRLTALSLPVVTREYSTVSENIPAPTEKKYDETQREGKVTVASEGESGKKEVTLIVTRRNGEIVNEEIVEESLLAVPAARVELIGTRRPSGTGTGTFIRPAPGVLTSAFGPRWGRMHEGVDFAGDTGDLIAAADGGTVIFSGSQNGYGNIIILDHKN